jgi:hypothetical protein
LVVLNQVFPGCGWLSARHALGEGEYHRQLSDRLAEWIAEIYAPNEPVDIMLSGDCNGLQAHPRFTRRVLQWHIEPSADVDGRAIPIAAVFLHHAVDSGLLEMLDAEGRRVAPIYLGTTVPHPAWGTEFWLTTLGIPYRIRRRMEEIMPPSETGADVLALPERRVGRVILSRRAWWMTSARVRRLWYRRGGAARLLDVATDCAALAVPRRLFVRAARAPTHATNDDHKPLWIDTRNPFCLDVLFPLLRRTRWLLLTEALPEFPVWPKLSEQVHASELLVEMVL